MCSVAYCPMRCARTLNSCASSLLRGGREVRCHGCISRAVDLTEPHPLSRRITTTRTVTRTVRVVPSGIVVDDVDVETDFPNMGGVKQVVPGLR